VPDLKLALDLTSLARPWEEALHAAATLGIAAVELEARGGLAPGRLSRTGVRQIRKTLDDYGLRVASLKFRTRRGYAAQDRLEERIAATKAAQEMAHDLGASIVLNQIGRVPTDQESAEWKLLVDVLTDLGQASLKTGATLVAETGSESGADLARLLAALPEGFLGIDLNPGNLLMHGFAPAEVLSAVGPHVMAFHVTDARHDGTYATGELETPGRGSADYPALLSTLDELAYRGHFTLVATGRKNTLEEIAHDRDFLRKL